MQLRLLRFWAGYRTHFRETITLSAPVIVGQLGIVLMGVADNVMIGDLGYEYLSAASLANSIFFILTVIGMGVTFAISPLVAEADSSGKSALCGMYLRQGTWVAIGTSLVLGVLMYLASLTLPYIDQPEQDIVLGTPYLHLLNVSVLPMLLFLVFKQFSDGLSLTRPAMYITMLGLLVNILANWLFIHGNWGFPRWELNGAGVATLLSRIFMFLMMAGYLLYSSRFDIYRLRTGWYRLRSTVIKKIIAIGVPSGFQYFFEVCAFGGAVIMVGWLGMADRSAHQIVINLSSITYMFVSGLSAGAAIRVGSALGRRDWPGVFRAGMAGLYLATVLMLFFAAILYLGRNRLPAFYVEDPGVLTLAASLMLFAAFFQVFDGVQAVAIGILRGIQDVLTPTFITFIAYWVISLPMGYIIGIRGGMGTPGIWVGFVAGLGMAALTLTLRFIYMTRKPLQQKPLSTG